MWLRMSKICNFGAIDEPLVDYSIHSGQFSFSKYLKGRYMMIESHQDIKHNKEILSYHLIQIGLLKLISGDKSGIKEILKALVINPFMKGNISNIFASIFDIRTKLYILKFMGKL